MKLNTIELENMIARISTNIELHKKRGQSPVTTLYTTIFNTLCNDFSYIKTERLLDADRINHYGTDVREYKVTYEGTGRAKALLLSDIRRVIPYNTAVYLADNPSSDMLFHKLDGIIRAHNAFFWTRYGLRK